MKVIKLIKKVFFGFFLATALLVIADKPVFAENVSSSFQLSPMNQRITLVPGERYYGTFKVTNPATNQYYFSYNTEITPFSVDEDYNPQFATDSTSNNGDRDQILDWITIINPKGLIAPNATAIVQFYIDTPNDAPAGGQYASIIVGSKPTNESGEGINIKAEYSMAHLLYADVAGETVRGGEINDIRVPSFLFSGNITGTSSIKNTGNVHSDATYILQIFPPLSKEEIYTNEENPDSAIIFPDTTRTTTISWPNTPKIGIFHVIYTVSFEGVDSQVDKYVIICPIWLLIVIIALIFLILFKIIFTGKDKKEK